MTKPLHQSLTPKVLKTPRRSIKSSLSIHDRTQIEAVFDYYLFRGPHKPQDPSKLTYQVDAYFFFPQQFGLNQTTYPKVDFFNDIRPLIRLREPKMGLKALKGQKQGIYPSPLQSLQHLIGKAKGSDLTEDHVAQGIIEARIFACVFIGTLLRNVAQWQKKLKKLEEAANSTDHTQGISSIFIKLSKFTSRLQIVVNDFHNLRKACAGLEDPKFIPLCQELKLVDEYLFYRLSDALSMIYKYSDPWYQEYKAIEISDFHNMIAQLMKSYAQMAHKEGFMVIQKSSSPIQKERYLNRRSELKKRFWAVFFLNLRTAPFFPVQQQIGPMIAAGLAAIWAAVAQLLILDKLIQSKSQVSLLEVSTMVLVFSAMFAYVVKDRIKEIGRSLFKGRIFRKIPDQSETIYYGYNSKKDSPIGKLTESASFIQPDRVPQAIKRIRHWAESHSLELTDHDDILHYSKEVSLNGEITVQNRYSTRVIHDIIRFNIDACLPKLAEPIRTLPIIDTELAPDLQGDSPLSMDFVEFPKVYTFDLALRYSQRKDAKSREIYIKYFRFTIHKLGLLRVETLNPTVPHKGQDFTKVSSS